MHHISLMTVDSLIIHPTRLCEIPRQQMQETEATSRTLRAEPAPSPLNTFAERSDEMLLPLLLLPAVDSHLIWFSDLFIYLFVCWTVEGRRRPRRGSGKTRAGSGSHSGSLWFSEKQSRTAAPSSCCFSRLLFLFFFHIKLIWLVCVEDLTLSAL